MRYAVKCRFDDMEGVVYLGSIFTYESGMKEYRFTGDADAALLYDDAEEAERMRYIMSIAEGSEGAELEEREVER